MMALVNLETAIYWGQLSQCKHLDHTYPQYSCDDKSAYGSVSAFASLLLISQGFAAFWLALQRADFIDETGVYDEVNAADGKSDYVDV